MAGVRWAGVEALSWRMGSDTEALGPWGRVLGRREQVRAEGRRVKERVMTGREAEYQRSSWGCEV